MTKSLDESLSFFKDKISDCIKSKKSISVTTHIDCDGLTSGSIITKALIRAGANCTVRTSKEFSKNVLESFKTDSRDFHVVTDLGGGFANELDKTLGDNWIVLDHHQISDEEKDNQNVINSWKYGIDGGVEICAGGMAYLASVALDERNTDLSAIAVVSALGDRQDQGERKSFIGKNFEIANVAKEQGLVDIDLDLLLVGRETRPLVDALAFTSQPFIEGLTWNRDT
jgi:RecJ-like exonuclease